ncbi:uncharacterized protein LOC119163156 isoform X1 [Rhipicephalus microplus]|uniref:uncharacterized protein LOC119163156 isoform X1 n=1 Tax=Rhipicephalus microplus TaxID=6941 RepID=UPI003F6B63AB
MHKELLKAIFILSIVKETQHIPVCCIPARRLLTYSMKQFVDTSELIWAVKTTKPGNIKCQYDEKRLISENYIIYNTTFFQGRQRYSIRLRGDFDPEAPNRMLVSTLDAGAPSLLSLVLTFWFSVPSRVLYMVPFSVETLLYETHNNSCGVVKMEILTGAKPSPPPSDLPSVPDMSTSCSSLLHLKTLLTFAKEQHQKSYGSSRAHLYVKHF